MGPAATPTRSSGHAPCVVFFCIPHGTSFNVLSYQCFFPSTFCPLPRVKAICASLLGNTWPNFFKRRTSLVCVRDFPASLFKICNSKCFLKDKSIFCTQTLIHFESFFFSLYILSSLQKLRATKHLPDFHFDLSRLSQPAPSWPISGHHLFFSPSPLVHLSPSPFQPMHLSPLSLLFIPL